MTGNTYREDGENGVSQEGSLLSSSSGQEPGMGYLLVKSEESEDSSGSIVGKVRATMGMGKDGGEGAGGQGLETRESVDGSREGSSKMGRSRGGMGEGNWKGQSEGQGEGKGETFTRTQGEVTGTRSEE